MSLKRRVGSGRDAQPPRKARRKAARTVNSEASDVEFEVEKIIEVKFVRGEPKYHVKWKGYDETSWEPESNLHCPELLNKFKAAQLQEARALKKKATRKADLPDRGSHVTAKIPAKHQEGSEGLEEVYEVEKILRETFRFGLSYFEVKWKGYSQTSWEPASNLNCPDNLEKFRHRQKAARQAMLENSAPAEVTDATGT
ncbi:hypothetical protein PF005_g30971, partial [Phytophthora fragariae]